jgi:polyhydroxyalkanoate synthesis regulator phasin
MTEEELRRVLQDIVADKDRRAEDRTEENRRKKIETQFMAIAAYTALAALIGGAVLWVGDARTGQLLKPLSDEQIAMKGEIKSQKENTDELKQTVKEGFSEIKALLKK